MNYFHNITKENCFRYHEDYLEPTEHRLILYNKQFSKYKNVSTYFIFTCTNFNLRSGMFLYGNKIYF